MHSPLGVFNIFCGAKVRDFKLTLNDCSKIQGIEEHVGIRII
jgi:hypothetical protein